MNKENDAKLVADYPDIFRDRNEDITKTPMAWGVSCGDGWFNIIDRACALISNHTTDRPFVAVQVKEKFGSLRFYYVGGDEYCAGIVAMAEAMSGRTCEMCGDSGKMRTDGGWYQTLCDKHAGERVKTNS